MRFEAREGMGSGYPFNGNYFSDVAAEEAESVLVAQEVVRQKGKPFTPISQQEGLLETNFFDQHHAHVQVMVDGETCEGFGASNDRATAYAEAFYDALHPQFPGLRGIGSPHVRVNQNGHSYTELELSTGSQRLVSRNGGLTVSPQEMGKMVAELLMAAVHLTKQ